MNLTFWALLSTVFACLKFFRRVSVCIYFTSFWDRLGWGTFEVGRDTHKRKVQLVYWVLR